MVLLADSLQRQIRNAYNGHAVPTSPSNLEPVLPQNPFPTPEITEQPPLYTACCSDKSTLPSFVDERVPSLPTIPPATQIQHTVMLVPLKRPTLGQTPTTGLNPSLSSRFTGSRYAVFPTPLLLCSIFLPR
jgi:hypothetical protein